MINLRPLPRKDWKGVPIDASDRDGGNGNSGNSFIELSLLMSFAITVYHVTSRLRVK